MRRQKKIMISDVVYTILAMLIMVFMYCFISGIIRYIHNGFFEAVRLSWTEITNWIGSTIFGIERYRADIEIPIVNAHINLVSYMR